MPHPLKLDKPVEYKNSGAPYASASGSESEGTSSNF